MQNKEKIAEMVFSLENYPFYLEWSSKSRKVLEIKDKFLADNPYSKEIEDCFTPAISDINNDYNQRIGKEQYIKPEIKRDFDVITEEVDWIVKGEKANVKDILQEQVEEKYMLSEKLVKWFLNKSSIFRDRFKITSPDEKWACLTTNNQWSCITQSYILCNINPSWSGQNWNVYSSEGKSPTLTTNKGEWPKILQLPRGANKGGIFEQKTPTLSSNSRSYNNLLHDGYCLRRLTPIECERLQTLPDDYTAGVSNSQRYKMLWNGRTVDVIAHIFREMFHD